MARALEDGAGIRARAAEADEALVAEAGHAGAGGSIGSEIARQVSRYGPARLLLLDRDDSLLFEAVSSLDKAEPILADIRDESRLRDIFDPKLARKR